MGAQKIIDSHVHLWPEHMASSEYYTWLNSAKMLARHHDLHDYSVNVNNDAHQDDNFEVEGLIYIEADARYDTPSADNMSWAQRPLDEIRYLRSVVEGEADHPSEPTLAGIVIWAPLDRSTDILRKWLEEAKETAGGKTWGRIKGVRFLLQAILDKAEFEALVLSQGFIDNLRLLGQYNLSFDVGVDARSGGIWQLQIVAQSIYAALQGVPDEEQTIFVLNHLCKPDLAASETKLAEWSQCMHALAANNTTYMKFSGAFNETTPDLVPSDEAVKQVLPWLQGALHAFGPGRVMFGSDWPVCNIRRGGQDRWWEWLSVASTALEAVRPNLTTQDCDHIWQGTAKKAYRLS